MEAPMSNEPPINTIFPYPVIDNEPTQTHWFIRTADFIKIKFCFLMVYLLSALFVLAMCYASLSFLFGVASLSVGQIFLWSAAVGACMGIVRMIYLFAF
jgi:hypothetical protein